MNSLGTVMHTKQRLETYKANREAGSYKGTEGYFNIDEVAALVEAAELVVKSWGPVEFGQTTFTDLLCNLRKAVEAADARFSKQEGE